MKIFAIDPGNTHSGYAYAETGAKDISKILGKGKIPNEDLLALLLQLKGKIDLLAIEMVAHYGKNMAAGATTFHTCVWIGRFIQLAHQSLNLFEGGGLRLIYRREEKINLLGSAKGLDKDIRIALLDRYAPGQPNYGKGHKAKPGFFYGMANDAWQAFAVLVTAYDIYVRGISV